MIVNMLWFLLVMIWYIIDLRATWSDWLTNVVNLNISFVRDLAPISDVHSLDEKRFQFSLRVELLWELINCQNRQSRKCSWGSDISTLIEADCVSSPVSVVLKSRMNVCVPLKAEGDHPEVDFCVWFFDFCPVTTRIGFDNGIWG